MYAHYSADYCRHSLRHAALLSSPFSLRCRRLFRHGYATDADDYAAIRHAVPRLFHLPYLRHYDGAARQPIDIY